MSLARFSVNNSVFLNILMVALLLFGIFSAGRMPREQYDEVPFFFVNIIVPYPGAGAEDVERQVTIPLENEMQSLDELKEISSLSSEGLSLLQIEFDDGISQAKFDKLFSDVRTNFAKASLPEGVLEETIDDFSSTDFLPVAEVVLSGQVDYSRLLRTAERLESDIRPLADVSDVEIIGARDRQIAVILNRADTESRGITQREVAQAIEGVNVAVPGGTFVSEEGEYLIRTTGGLTGPDSLGKVIVRSGNGGEGVRIDQIARVTERFDPEGTKARFNGEPSLVLRITKLPGGDGVAIIDGIKETLNDYRLNTTGDISFTLVNDSTIQIRNSLNVLLNNVLIGLAFLVVILFLFVGLRNSLMTALGIPVTFAAAFIVLEITGETFNTNTLFGLVLVLGLVVDHAIVIIENSYRLREQGLSPREAAIQGTGQVAIPVMAATGTTVAAFLPLMILPGTIGKFLRVIPLTVSIALILSTAEALLFIPAHFAHWPGKGKEEGESPRWNQFKKGFSRLLAKLYGRKGITLIGLLGLMVMSFTLVPLLETDLFSAEDFTLFYIDVEMAPGTTLERTEEVLARYETRILPLVGRGEVSSLSLSVGFLGGDNESRETSNVGQITVDLTERGEGRTRSIAAVMEEIRSFTEDIPGPEYVEFRKATNGPPSDAPVAFRLFGDSRSELTAASERLQEELRTFPELFSIRDDYGTGTPELRIRVNEERASVLGLSPLMVGQAVKEALEGYGAGSYFKDNEEREILVLYEGAGLGRLEEILQLSLTTPQGERVPFSALCWLEPVTSPAAISRVDGERQIQVTAEAYSTENLSEINRAVEEVFRRELAPRYPGVTLKLGGEFSEFSDLLIQILRIFLIGIFLIYLILASQFNSYSQPLIILFSVPFAFMGVIFFLLLSNIPFSITVIYAGVALSGIAVNDSIVLMSFINEKRKEGRSVSQAVREAAAVRLRPILLTSLTTIAGLLPTALGLGGRSVVWGPMAGTIVFGLIFSTLTSLIYIPCLYGLLYDRKKRGKEE
ncbi:MAG: efflux RND transporter permease subunit [Spirochaetales bacterium]|nr:efflux RND transporter permease subunit [Spirochaetales bacterium]